MSKVGDAMIIIQGRTLSPNIDTALDKIHDRLTSLGLTGEPRVWYATVQYDKNNIWFEYSVICEEVGTCLEDRYSTG